MAMITKSSLLNVLVLYSVFVSTDCLLCYQCGDSIQGASCMTDIETMQQDFSFIKDKKPNKTIDNKYEPKYVKNCSQVVNASSCIIERIESRGATHAFLRDCSDGFTFSVPLDRLQNLKPDNTTTCGFKGTGFVICITLCNEDLCNGPQVESTGHVTTICYPLILTTLFLFCMGLKRDNC